LPNRIKGACERQYPLLHKAGWIPSEDAGKDGKTGHHLSLLSIGQLKTCRALCRERECGKKWMTPARPSTNTQNGWNLIYDLTSRDSMTQLLSQYAPLSALKSFNFIEINTHEDQGFNVETRLAWLIASLHRREM
jgi:hypothetical protein